MCHSDDEQNFIKNYKLKKNMENQAPTTTQVNSYLNFNGNCDEAMTFYAQVLGGQIVMKSTFGEGPMEVDESFKDKIMHAHLTFDDCSILASDNPGDQAFIPGNNYNISVYFPDKARAQTVYNQLSEGGVPAMPFNEVFWGGSFGMLVDKFGVQWMVSCP